MTIVWAPLLIFLILAPGLAVAGDKVAEADKLLQDPALDLCGALKAMDLYAGCLAQSNPPKLSLLTRLSRLCFIIGELTVRSQRQKYYERGQCYAETLVKQEPNRVEGHYWLAMHLCGQADTGGSMLARRLLPQIMEEMRKAEIFNAAYDQGGSHRVLGRIYYEAPAWPLSVGDLQKSLQHLTMAVRLAPKNSTNHLYLAETLIKLNREDDARWELEQVIKAEKHAMLPRGLEEDRREARRLLELMVVAEE